MGRYPSPLYYKPSVNSSKIAVNERFFLPRSHWPSFRPGLAASHRSHSYPSHRSAAMHFCPHCGNMLQLEVWLRPWTACHVARHTLRTPLTSCRPRSSRAEYARAVALLLSDMSLHPPPRGQGEHHFFLRSPALETGRRRTAPFSWRTGGVGDPAGPEGRGRRPGRGRRMEKRGSSRR